MKKEPADHIGEKHGRLTIKDWKREGRYIYFLCECQCGTTRWFRGDGVLNGKTKSCGCSRRKDLTGKEYGLLKAIKRSERKYRNGCIWICECRCGNTIEVSESDLERGRKTHCGCQKKIHLEQSAQQAREKNREKNMREGTSLARIKSTKVPSSSTTGVRGVYYNAKRNYWYAQITFKGKTKHLGIFKTKNAAIKARRTAEEIYFNPLIEKYSKPE
ncbi:AP2 domain-containing protein [Eubacterium sp. 1001713B170207_170306_E7]|uniref:AP2 domain-containing protein n=1 Tax=Eubacterium sp. 1001713B170207_170306_E7 TaxID=2787097 RepID=UPI0018997C0B|nr:AP2 domain-containing protein [Eubacterium sp. 1001713B170207_170306_E7]